MGLGKVQARGQVTIPAEVRHAAHIELGDTLLFEVTGEGRMQVTVIPTHVSFDDLFDRYKVSTPFDAERARAEVEEQIVEDVLDHDTDLALAEAAATSVKKSAPAAKVAAKKPPTQSRLRMVVRDDR